MSTPDNSADLDIVVDDGDVAVLYCPAAFQLAPVHPMRKAHCVICGEMIGGQYATIVAIGALAGDACQCGGVVADAFLLHADHLPMSAEQLQEAVGRALHCERPHVQPA